MKTVNAVVMMMMVVVWLCPETLWSIHKPNRSPTRSPSLSVCVGAVWHPRMSRGEEEWREEEGWRGEKRREQGSYGAGCNTVISGTSPSEAESVCIRGHILWACRSIQPTSTPSTSSASAAWSPSAHHRPTYVIKHFVCRVLGHVLQAIQYQPDASRAGRHREHHITGKTQPTNEDTPKPASNTRPLLN